MIKFINKLLLFTVQLVAVMLVMSQLNRSQKTDRKNCKLGKGLWGNSKLKKDLLFLRENYEAI